MSKHTTIAITPHHNIVFLLSWKCGSRRIVWKWEGMRRGDSRNGMRAFPTGKCSSSRPFGGITSHSCRDSCVFCYFIPMEFEWATSVYFTIAKIQRDNLHWKCECFYAFFSFKSFISTKGKEITEVEKINYLKFSNERAKRKLGRTQFHSTLWLLIDGVDEFL